VRHWRPWLGSGHLLPDRVARVRREGFFVPIGPRPPPLEETGIAMSFKVSSDPHASLRPILRRLSADRTFALLSTETQFALLVEAV